jgi:murein DD-endopeptidase MepM/ murein hydrolase activator NlpD
MIIIGFLLLSTLSIIAPQVKASPGVPPEVVCVPFHGQLAAVPHDTWIGKEIILKGTAHDKDGDGTMTAYRWDFSDGYSTDWISGVNPYIIEARHTYTGTMADGTPYSPGKYFTAWLYVKDNEGLEGKDSYFIAIRDKTLDVEVNLALDNGLWWLHKQQTRGTYGDGTEYGYWYSSYGYHISFTAASTEAFELQGHLPSGDRSEDPYVETVQRGLNYLFNQFYTYSISQDATYCPLGNPDVNSNGKGLACFSGDINRQIYETGMALMTISSSSAPSRIAATGTSDVIGRAYKDIVQDMVDFLAWGQNDPYTGVYEGGWRYYANYGYSDNSVSQWPVIGMEAAERNFGTSGVTVPAFVRPELLKWLAYSQGGDGGFGYTDPGSWENTAKTGAGCAMLSWAGVPTTDTKFQNALSFLNAHWYDTASSYTNFGDYYTMYGIMKGMRIPDPNIQLVGTHDWYAEYARYIVDQQNAYGGEYVVDHSWLSGNVEGILATAWAMAVLTPTLVKPGPVAEAGPNVDNFPPTIPVKFDASGSYHRDPTKSIVLYEWDFESDGTWDYSVGQFVYPTGLAPTAPGGKRSYGYDGACTYYNYAGWLARGDDYLDGKYHLGQDIEADVGDNVYAITDGVVAYISYSTDWGSGNLGIVLRHKLSDGTELLALYGHVRSDVSIGDNINSGESFATIGPYDSIAHLHFGIHPGLTMPETHWGAMNLASWPDPNASPGDPNGPDTNGFVDPLDWIATRTPIKPTPLHVEHAYPAYKNPDGSIDWDTTTKDYTATLRVTDDNDPALHDTDTCVVHITPPPWKPVADPDGPYEGSVGGLIQLDGSKSYDPESKMYPPGHPWYETIAKYEWDLNNDGKFDDSVDVKPSYTWNAEGAYSVGLKVTDSQPSGSGGTIGPLDVDIKYATVVVKEEVTGIESVITLDDFTTNGILGQDYFSIQQNFKIPIGSWSGYPTHYYWVQNIVYVFRTLGVSWMAGEMEIWEMDGVTTPKKVAFSPHFTDPETGEMYSVGYPGLPFALPETVILRSTIESDSLILENDFWGYTFPVPEGSYVYVDPSASSITTHKGRSPEIVIVGLGQVFGYDTFMEVDFDSPTSGHVDNYVRMSSGTWLVANNTVVPQGFASTAETSTGLDWDTNGDFEYKSGKYEQGFWFEPDFSKPEASPPSPSAPSLSAEALMFLLRCPAELSLYDSLGRHIGYNVDTAKIDLEIPSALYLIFGSAQCIFAYYPADAYELFVIGTGTGTYRLDILWMDKGGGISSVGSYEGAISEGTVFRHTILTAPQPSVIMWEHVFEDPVRKTVLKISTDDKYFQFIAPDKDFGVKYAAKMTQLKHVIIICYEDKQMRLTATATDDKTCLAVAWDKQTCKAYWLIEHPPVYKLTVCCNDTNGKAISSASVYFNGCCQGQTDSNGNLTITNVFSGTYTVTVKKCGYKDSSSTVTVSGDTTLTLTMTPQTYTLTVCCKNSKGKVISGASIYLNGNYQGLTDLSGKLIITNITAGTYTVTAKKGGYKDTSVNVTMTRDKTITITMK